MSEEKLLCGSCGKELHEDEYPPAMWPFIKENKTDTHCMREAIRHWDRYRALIMWLDKQFAKEHDDGYSEGKQDAQHEVWDDD
jgi:competence CoiA-like predicted nuclease